MIDIQIDYLKVVGSIKINIFFGSNKCFNKSWAQLTLSFNTPTLSKKYFWIIDKFCRFKVIFYKNKIKIKCNFPYL